ncbi:MAG: DUF4373 domain-containing protein [Candidatus Kapabacteria bacterium]|nr:DUF4373 domain-containing protein [Candidatus Kapabacteria bacterium]
MIGEKRYFPHDEYARSDDKILMLRAEYRMEGYGTYYCLLEMMLESKETHLRHDKTEGIAASLGCPNDTFDGIVSLCIEQRLFDTDGEYFWSPRLLEWKKLLDSQIMA